MIGLFILLVSLTVRATVALVRLAVWAMVLTFKLCYWLIALTLLPLVALIGARRAR